MAACAASRRITHTNRARPFGFLIHPFYTTNTMRRQSNASRTTKQSLSSLSCSSETDPTIRQASITSFFTAQPRRNDSSFRKRKMCSIKPTVSQETRMLDSGEPLPHSHVEIPAPTMTTCVPNLASKSIPKTSKSLQQMYLDFGQKSFGEQTLCLTCGMLYDARLDEDSQQHKRVCADYIHGVPFQAASARVVVSINTSTSIIEVRPNDSHALLNKVAQVRLVVDNELGFVPTDECDKTGERWTYLYIRDKRVIGMASAQSISHAYKLHENNSARGRDKQAAMVGIYQIWVHSKYRRQGIASMLVDAVREKMIFGLIIPKDRVAFSSPTLAGASFGRRYMCSPENKRTEQLLVYDC